MKKTKIFIILYIITTIIFTIAGFFLHVIVIWEHTGEINYIFRGFELYSAPLFIMALIFLLKSKIEPAIIFHLIGCVIYGIELFFVYYIILGFDSMKFAKITIYYPGFYMGIYSYVFFIFLMFLMCYIYNFKEIAKKWGLIPNK